MPDRTAVDPHAGILQRRVAFDLIGDIVVERDLRLIRIGDVDIADHIGAVPALSALVPAELNDRAGAVSLIAQIRRGVADAGFGFRIADHHAVDEGAEPIHKLGPRRLEIHQRIEPNLRIDPRPRADHLLHVVRREMPLIRVVVKIIDHVSGDVRMIQRQLGDLAGPADVVGSKGLGISPPRGFLQRRLRPRHDVGPHLDVLLRRGVGERRQIVPVVLVLPDEVVVGVDVQLHERVNRAIDVDALVPIAYLAAHRAESRRGVNINRNDKKQSYGENQLTQWGASGCCDYVAV